MQPIQAYGYFYTAPNEPLERRKFVIEEVAPDEVVVKVAGCGLCHTDLSFYSGQVKTKAALPLVLGHEFSGEVVAAGTAHQRLLGKQVIVPAVLPCGECELCKADRDNICQHQKMPGNDFHGGFASHAKVPGRFLCELPNDLKGYQVHELSVIADAVTTPYQSIQRSGLKKGELAIVIGVGGIGTYMVQLAKATGAHVIALDIDDKKLARAVEMGADHILQTRELNEREIKKAVRNLVKEHNLPRYQWKVFECSGVGPGQAAAYALMSFAGTIGFIGFSMDKIPVRLGNLMAFDAEIFGNWGCRPAHYPAVVQAVLHGQLKLRENIELHPLDQINDVIQQALAHTLERRAILLPGEQT